jgi:hypothetical protein
MLRTTEEMIDDMIEGTTGEMTVAVIGGRISSIVTQEMIGAIWKAPGI